MFVSTGPLSRAAPLPASMDRNPSASSTRPAISSAKARRPMCWSVSSRPIHGLHVADVAGMPEIARLTHEEGDPLHYLRDRHGLFRDDLEARMLLDWRRHRSLRRRGEVVDDYVQHRAEQMSNLRAVSAARIDERRRR
jgi:hypothetical protein